jgi:hypothetical protein
VGGLPKRPQQAVADADLEACMACDDKNDDSRKLDWQLSVTSAFFDYCVPNQPGFSSSVAAVTILPSASELATAWKKWYKATRRLTQLRFIRRQLLERGYLHVKNNIDSDDDDDSGDYDVNGDSSEGVATTHHVNRSSDDVEAVYTGGSPSGSPQKARVLAKNSNEHAIYLQESTKRLAYTNEVLGSITDEDVEVLFLRSLRMGPEQTAVYSMELAKAAAGCCPHGCCEERILCSDIPRLLELEAEAVERARESFLELEAARKRAALAQDERTKQQALNDNNRKGSLLWRHNVVDTPAKTDTGKKTLDKSVEARLFGKGHATLEQASAHYRTPQSSQRFRKSSVDSTADPAVPIPAPRPFGGADRRDSADSFKSAASQMVSSLANYDDIDSDLAHYPAPPRPGLTKDSSRFFPSLIKHSMASSMIFSYNSDPEPRGDDTSRPSAAAVTKSLEPWEIVEMVATESDANSGRRGQLEGREHRVSDGIWKFPTPKLVWGNFYTKTCSMLSWTVSTSEQATDLKARDSSFAVVTFTSRQAAIAARRCLADGRGAGRWRTIDEVPVPPLADASAFNILDCRGCNRPVTVTLNEHQKTWRNTVAMGMLGAIYLFYTFPITWAATFGSEKADEIQEFFPQGSSSTYDKDALQGLIRAQLLTVFLSVCPHMFLAIANFGSNATSMVGAEYAAMQYYWWFMVLFALVGSSIAQMALSSFKEGSFQFVGALQRVARTVPAEV